MNKMNRRSLITAAGASAAWLASTQLDRFSGPAFAAEAQADSMPMQLYKSLNDQQRHKVCLPIDHPRRQYVSNWWYIHPDYHIPSTFDDQQQELIQTIFDSLHSPEHQDAVNKQVHVDQYGQTKNAPAVGFFGTPEDDDFEFIYTGHHVTRRCNAHTDKGLGFGGAPIFYGHFLDEFNETKDHPGNPYWYQGKVFNQFVQALDSGQQARALVGNKPRSEKPAVVIKKKQAGWSGLPCSELDAGQKKLFIGTMKKMMAMFRSDDVEATLAMIEKKGIIDRLYVSWYDGKYDIGSDKVWDTWQIEGPEMVWYFRGQPHIHSYFHLKS
jgi:hypothetical protein